jgi:uncharacterized protein
MTLRATDGTGFLPRLARFVSFLRVRGVPVGIGAEIDCAQALERITLLDRDAFLDACKVTLAKSPSDAARIEEAFDVFWSMIIPAVEAETPLAVAAQPSPPPDGVASAVEAPTGVRITADREAVIRVGVYSPDAPSLGHFLARQDRRRLLALRAGARRFRRQTATLPGRRFIGARRGAIDFLATARHSLRQGGEWVEFRFRRPKRLRSELVVLWDVSGSMRDHDADLFAVVYSLFRVIHRTRVFAFGTQLKEVTDGLRGRSYTAAAEAVSRSLASIGGGTRIGPCLEQFLREHGRLLHPWTSAILLSDGWDRGDTASLGRALERMNRLAHLLVWVNPYADEKGFEPATAGMQKAMPHLDFLLGPGDFETTRSFAPERIEALRPGVRSKRWGKAFIQPKNQVTNVR